LLKFNGERRRYSTINDFAIGNNNSVGKSLNKTAIGNRESSLGRVAPVGKPIFTEVIFFFFWVGKILVGTKENYEDCKGQCRTVYPGNQNYY
jgi:hypothetical protein